MMSWNQIRQSEPVRVWVYPLMVSALGIAVQQGVISADTQGIIIGLVSGVLGIGVVEAVRGRVTPVRAAQHVYVNPAPGYELPAHNAGDVFESGGAHAQTEQFPVVTVSKRPRHESP